MSYFKPIIFIALITLSSSVFAQSKRELKIKAERDLEIAKVFNSHGETFKITKVPEKWNNESAVIISQLKKYDFLIDGGDLVVKELLRQRLKIQDKAALEEFSKLYFTIPEGDSYRDNGLYIIKPDGTKNNIDINDAIEVEKGASSRNYFSFKTYQPKGYKYYKLAIPNLEIDDIIDFYSKKEIRIPKENKGSVIPFGAVINNLPSEYTIMNQKVDLSVDRSFYITANTYNGAPKLIEGGPGIDYKGRTKATIRTFSLIDSDREKKSDEYWVDISKEAKLKFQIFYATKKYLYYNPEYFIGDLDSIKEKVTTKEIVDRVSTLYNDLNVDNTYGYKFLDAGLTRDNLYKDWFNYDFENYNGKLNDTLKAALHTYYHMRWYWWSALADYLRRQDYYEKNPYKNGYYADTKETENMLKYVREEVPSDYEWAAYTMDDIRFLWYSKRDHWDKELFKNLSSSNNIKHEVIVCVPKYLGSIDDILFMDELTYGVRIGGENGICLFPPKNNSTMDNMNKYLEGTEAIAIKVVDYDDGDRYAKEFEKITLKKGSFKENTIKEITTLDFKDDPKKNVINRTTKVTGNYRPMYIEDDLYGIDYWSEFKDDFKQKEGLSKKQLKKLEQKKSFSFEKIHIQQERERRKQVNLDEIKKKKQELMEEKIKDDFNLVSYDNFELVSNGMRESNKTLEFKETFTVTGLVNKAGNNLILDIGKLIGSQIEIDEEEINNRKSDISLSRARTIENEVKINLPEGYYVEGLDNLLFNIDNEIGAFKTSFSEHNGQITIKTIKLYKKKEFGKDKWPLMVEFLDAAYNFTQKKVVLKK